MPRLAASTTSPESRTFDPPPQKTKWFCKNMPLVALLFMFANMDVCKSRLMFLAFAFDDHHHVSTIWTRFSLTGLSKNVSATTIATADATKGM